MRKYLAWLSVLALVGLVGTALGTAQIEQQTTMGSSGTILPGAADTTSALDVTQANNVTVWVQGTADSLTTTIQVRTDGTTWYTLGAAHQTKAGAGTAAAFIKSYRLDSFGIIDADLGTAGPIPGSIRVICNCNDATAGDLDTCTVVKTTIQISK